MAHKPEDFTLYDILVEAESFFQQQAETYSGYKQGGYWAALHKAASLRRQAEGLVNRPAVNSYDASTPIELGHSMDAPVVSMVIPWTWYEAYMKARGPSLETCPCRAHTYERQRRNLAGHVRAASVNSGESQK